MKKSLLVIFTVILFSATGVYAELHDRGGGMIYDDVLDVTWLQDANYGAGSAYDDGLSTTDGRMTWDNAVTWADTLVYQGYDDWRLPTTVDGPFVSGYDGTTTADYNITSSELGYMYYVTLGNLGYYATDGTNPQSGWGLSNAGPFTNLQPYSYWSGTNYGSDPLNAWYFRFNDGYQSSDRKYSYYSGYCAWAVRDGDVARVKYDLKGREYFPGITIGATTFGARFAGQILNAEGEAIGHFDTSLNHQGGPIEQCGATNIIVYFKLKMNFFDGRRLVLVMPYGDTATADWDWDDAACPYGGRECDFYSVENRVPCESDVNPEVSLVAEVSNIPLTKRQIGSRGFDEISGGILYGWLIHTPPIFPAVIGTFVGN